MSSALAMSWTTKMEGVCQPFSIELSERADKPIAAEIFSCEIFFLLRSALMFAANLSILLSLITIC